MPFSISYKVFRLHNNRTPCISQIEGQSKLSTDDLYGNKIRIHLLPSVMVVQQQAVVLRRSKLESDVVEVILL